MSNDNTLPSRNETITTAASGMQVREGVLAVPGELKLHFGGVLESVSIAWRLAGPAGAPVVVALGGISASRRVWLPDEPRGGWWHEVVGAGLALDTHRFRILSFDYLGASADSTGPRDDAPFPTVSAYDQAELLLRLINHLGIASVARHCRRFVRRHGGAGLRRAFPGPRRAAHRHQRRGPCASDGERLARGAAADREVRHRNRKSGAGPGAGACAGHGHLPQPRGVRGADSPAPRAATAEEKFVLPVEEYLFARGAEYAQRYRPASFVCLSESIDLHRVDAGRIFAPVTAIAVREDQLVPLGDMRAMVARLPNAELHEISSVYGHDAFLKENRRLAPIFANVLNDNPGITP